MIGIISDIHGNYPALLSVVDELERMQVDEIICLGDVAGYYAQINECCDLVRQRASLVLQGNHDWYLVSGKGCPRSNSANRCLEHQRAIITEENLRWLSTHEAQGIYGPLNLVHGGWNDPLDEYMKLSPGYFCDLPGAYFASGHTHVPLLWEDREKQYCNPGSVGQPRDGDPRASFATFDGTRFSLHRVEYDISQTQQAMRAAGFPHYFYVNLSAGTRLGGSVDKTS